MDNYSYNSYPDSGNSSPRGSQSTHEIDFENTPSWEQENYKVKFMCSYGGKIIPRPHDNQLCYSGGETKILAVDRSIKFAVLISKLSSLCGDSNDVSFKYQLPGEDLDALISVTNDDDLDHMMHEYDRLYRGGASSARPARMRLFLFPTTTSLISHHHDSFGSDSSASFLDALNSGPIPKPPVQNNVDLLYGLGKGVAAVSSPPPPPQPTIPENVPPQARPGNRDRPDVDVGLDPAVEFQRRLQIGSDQPPDHQQQAMYPKATMEDNLVRGYSGAAAAAASGDYYMQKLPEKLAPVTAPPPAGYWPENHVSSVGYPGSATVMRAPEQQQQQPLYMISAAGGGGGVYHAPNPPMVRGVTAPVSSQGLGYYHHMQQQQQQPQPQQPQPQPQQQRMAMASDVYREQPVYNVVPPHPHQQQQAPMASNNIAPPKYVATYTETAPYTQVAYDGATGRQVYYTAPGGTVPYSTVGPAAVGSEMRVVAGGLSQEGKVVGSKVPQT